MRLKFPVRSIGLTLTGLVAAAAVVGLSTPAGALPLFGKKPETTSTTNPGAPPTRAKGRTSRPAPAIDTAKPETANPDAAAALPATPEQRRAARNLDLVNQAAFWLGEVEKNPKDDVAALEGSIALRKIGSAERAAQLAAMGIQVKAESPELWAALGMALVASGQNEPAVQALQKAISLNPKDPSLHNGLGVAYDKLDRADLAATAYEAALKIAPDDALTLTNYGLSVAMTGDLSKAETLLRRANQNPLAPPQTRQNLALVVGLQGRFDESERIASRDLTPEVASENVAYLKAMLNGGESRWAEARKETGN
ncbi:hypothetical protein PbB2_00480 [Candidatus Phycosocius bacilliformis]|uniref:Uncharacterized protein n=1 Tax=Candidatus Phycosocius bacilliformis TaxID=1445552 RepID=A0A2P2E6Z1_9PROT|nr:tetratricopeptide repeat protein [Candidatus Phycosocius bacilliformis]GBF56823.1 hypothetical protein PbB2_00480 [Candidatus Phycosocius bacilliformis]